MNRHLHPSITFRAAAVFRSAILLFIVMIALATSIRAANASSMATAWQRWEQQLESATDYPNPYADVTMRVRYSGPEGRVLDTYGFWDGGRTFRIRCAFPVAGTWRWETECSDPANAGLHGQRGTVEVQPYRGDHSLYAHGFLRVSDDRRYLTFADGTPFQWMGDTAWAVPYRATDPEWDIYLADRAAKHFSLIQVTTPPRWGATDFHGGATDYLGREPFVGATLNPWNPVYWQNVDRKIQRANEAGFMVFYVGLMEPTVRYPSSAEAQLFARNLVARLYGNFVIFSPSFDSQPKPLGNEVGQAIRDATKVHLISQHPATGPAKGPDTPLPKVALYYADEPYMDFISVQSGHNFGNRERCARHAIDWVLHLYGHEPRKPVINVEAMYDAHGDTNAWQGIDVRSNGWRSWLSGAMGYTYGAGDAEPKVPSGGGGIWRWVNDPDKFDYWGKALQWESSTQMKYLRDFFAAFEWWRLEPAHDLIRNQPEEMARHMVLARLPGRDFAVAYLPENVAIEIDVSGFSAPLSASWFNPREGDTRPVAEPVPNTGVHRFASPGGGDWVLVLKAAPKS